MNLKNLIKPILCILGGAALGGSVSYFFAHREIKALESDIEDFSEAVLERIGIVNSKFEENKKEEEESNTLRSNDGTEFTNDLNRGELTINKSIQKPDLYELVVTRSADDPSKLEVKKGSIALVDDNSPFLVAENAIDLNDDKYDSEVAYSYYEDGILTDENDDPVIDPDDILPSGWRDCFGWNCKSDDTFFAINPKLRLLIEVGRVESSYGQSNEE